MKKFQIFVSLFSLFAMAGFANAQQSDPMRVQMFLDIIAENGCSMTEDDAGTIFPSNGFDKEETRAIAGELIGSGRVSFANGLLSIDDGSCEQTAGLNADQLRFIEILALSGCQMTEDDARTIFPEHGMDTSLAFDIGEALIGVGIATLSENRESISVGPDYCTSLADNEPAPGLLSDPIVQQFLTILAFNGCSVSEEDVSVVFPEAGMSADLAFDAGERLMGAGLATFSESEGLMVAEPNCLAATDILFDEMIDDIIVDLDEPDAQLFFEIMADNGCSINESDVGSIFPAAGMSADQAYEIGEKLVDRGYGIFTPEEDLEILSAYCTPTNVSETQDQPAEMPVVDNMNLMISIMAENGCELDSSRSTDVFEAGGLDSDTGVALAMELVGQGLASIVDGSLLIIDAPTCVASNAGAPVVESEAPVDAASAESDGSDISVFVSVMVENGCSLTEDAARDVFAAAGLDMQVVYDIAEEFVAAGDAYFSDDDTTLTVTGAACTAANTPSQTVVEPVPDTAEVTPVTPDAMPVETGDNDETQFLALMAANGCEITQANAREITDRAGMDFNTAMGIAARMLNDGRAQTPDGGQTLQIDAPLCVAAGAAGPMGPRDIFIEVLKSDNCTMTAAEFGSLLPVDGLDQNTAFGLITDLEAEGAITLPASRDVVTLSAGLCQ